MAPASSPTTTIGEEEGKVAEACYRWQLVMIDAGLTASLSPTDRANLIEVFYAIIMNNGRRVGQLMIERSKPHTPTTITTQHKHTPLNAPLNTTNNDQKGLDHQDSTESESLAFQVKIEEIIKEVHKEGLSLKNVSISTLLQKLLIACYIHQVKLESKFVSLILALG